MACPQCGYEAPPESLCCPSCNNELRTRRAPEQPSPGDQDARTETLSRSGTRKKSPLGILTIIGLLLWKFKTILLVALGKLNFLLPILAKGKSFLAVAKIGKVFTTAVSMVVSMWFYAMFFGWKFAAGFILLILIHELGHVLVAWRKGIPVSAPVFIPFFGAAILYRRVPPNAAIGGQIGFGGPALGTVGGLVVLGLYYLTGDYLFLALANVAFWINLFNLIPLFPLDGGWIISSISPKLWIIGLAVFIIVCLQTGNPFMLLILFICLFQSWRMWKQRDSVYFQGIPPQTRVIMTFLYITLVVLLAFMDSYTHDLLMEWRRTDGQSI